MRLKGTDRSGILWCLSPLKNLVHVNFCELKILFSTKVTIILPAFHGREILPSTSDSASDKLFAETFSEYSNLDESGRSVPLCSS